MAEKLYNWTVDTEASWGGRTDGVEGIDQGLPLIFKLFREHDVKGLFFVSGEVLEKRPGLVRDIVSQGHEVGNHGYFHTCFKEAWRQHMNMRVNKVLLHMNCQEQSRFEVRAPKFSTVFEGHRYSDSRGHVGLLKNMWFGGDLNGDEIFYLHPFDIVGGKRPPNLFCRMWYSQPRKAYETLINLVTRYPGRNRLVQDTPSLR